jgi:imidazoleglycerol-phosphate dehydratase
MRTSSITRRTNETDIAIELNLDGTGQHSITTGIGFFDHMLTHLSMHGLFDLKVQAKGDLEVDNHHTIEDVAIVLGTAFDQALGDRKGIVRIAHAYVPMEDSLAFVAVDLSGRPYCIVQADWGMVQVGGVPVSLFTHFMESFAISGRLNIHARILYGRDDHHKAEALFKAFARAMDSATQIDPRRVSTIPSTKGSL